MLMALSPSYRIQTLTADDVGTMRAMLAMFGDAFDEPETYTAAVPREAYLANLLGGDSFVAVAALAGDEVVGGLAAYELRKFERERSEFYVYDLAVAKSHRRRGIATALIDELKRVAKERGAYVIFIQADHGDDPAIALYTKLGRREDVLHFDIAVD